MSGEPSDEIRYLSYRRLNAPAITATIAKLQTRIGERFPGSGLFKVATELLSVASESEERCRRIAEPQVKLRIVVGAISAFLVIALAIIPFEAKAPRDISLDELVQVTEASVNVLVLVGGGVLFLITSERRVKRSRVLAALEELRAIAHVIDMHQLTKDPQRVLLSRYDATKSSPKEALTPFRLFRYLDYCSEMFALIGKLAALYAQEVTDPVVVAAANELEGLTTGLSRKVWQKIMMIDAERQKKEWAAESEPKG